MNCRREKVGNFHRLLSNTGLKFSLSSKEIYLLTVYQKMTA